MNKGFFAFFIFAIQGVLNGSSLITTRSSRFFRWRESEIVMRCSCSQVPAASGLDYIHYLLVLIVAHQHPDKTQR